MFSNALLNGNFQRGAGNRPFIVQNKTRRNGFRYGQHVLPSKFSIAVVVVIVPFITEFRQGMLQYFAADFLSNPKLAGLGFSHTMQLGTHNLKKIGIALRFASRAIQCFIINVVTHPLQGNLESISRLRIVEATNAEFSYAVPKWDFNLGEAPRNVRGAGKDQQQWTTSTCKRLHVEKEFANFIRVLIQRVRLVD